MQTVISLFVLCTQPPRDGRYKRLHNQSAIHFYPSAKDLLIKLQNLTTYYNLLTTSEMIPHFQPIVIAQYMHWNTQGFHIYCNTVLYICSYVPIRLYRYTITHLYVAYTGRAQSTYILVENVLSDNKQLLLSLFIRPSSPGLDRDMKSIAAQVATVGNIKHGNSMMNTSDQLVHLISDWPARPQLGGLQTPRTFRSDVDESSQQPNVFFCGWPGRTHLVDILVLSALVSNSTHSWDSGSAGVQTQLGFQLCWCPNTAGILALLVSKHSWDSGSAGVQTQLGFWFCWCPRHSWDSGTAGVQDTVPVTILALVVFTTQLEFWFCWFPRHSWVSGTAGVHGLAGILAPLVSKARKGSGQLTRSKELAAKQNYSIRPKCEVLASERGWPFHQLRKYLSLSHLV